MSKVKTKSLFPLSQISFILFTKYTNEKVCNNETKRGIDLLVKPIDFKKYIKTGYPGKYPPINKSQLPFAFVKAKPQPLLILSAISR